jgi:hypothetical protein
MKNLTVPMIVPVDRGLPHERMPSGANRRNHQLEKYGCLSQACNKYWSDWSTVALHLAKRHRFDRVGIRIGIAESFCKRRPPNRIEFG